MSDGSVVVVGYTEDASTAGENAAYIARREDTARAPRAAALHAIGQRFAQAHGHVEETVRRLREDGERVAHARYYRLKLTCTDAEAARLARVDPLRVERILRCAAERATRAAQRGAQGALAVHGNGGDSREHGHPHVHVVLSPIAEDGRAVRLSASALDRLKREWSASLAFELNRGVPTERPRPSSRPTLVRSADERNAGKVVAQPKGALESFDAAASRREPSRQR